MGMAIKHPVSDRVKPPFAIFDIRAQMSKITNDSLTRSGTASMMLLRQCFTPTVLSLRHERNSKAQCGQLNLAHVARNKKI